MNKCQIKGCENDNLVVSGVDSFCREIPFVGRYCYSCSNAFFFIKKDIEELLEKMENEQGTNLL